MPIEILIAVAAVLVGLVAAVVATRIRHARELADVPVIPRAEAAEPWGEEEDQEEALVIPSSFEGEVKNAPHRLAAGEPLRVRVEDRVVLVDESVLLLDDSAPAGEKVVRAVRSPETGQVLIYADEAPIPADKPASTTLAPVEKSGLLAHVNVAAAKRVAAPAAAVLGLVALSALRRRTSRRKRS